MPKGVWGDTALHFGAPLLTHNRADFAAVPGLTVISAAP